MSCAGCDRPPRWRLGHAPARRCSRRHVRRSAGCSRSPPRRQSDRRGAASRRAERFADTRRSARSMRSSPLRAVSSAGQSACLTSRRSPVRARDRPFAKGLQGPSVSPLARGHRALQRALERSFVPVGAQTGSGEQTSDVPLPTRVHSRRSVSVSTPKLASCPRSEIWRGDGWATGLLGVGSS